MYRPPCTSLGLLHCVELSIYMSTEHLTVREFASRHNTTMCTVYNRIRARELEHMVEHGQLLIPEYAEFKVRRGGRVAHTTLVLLEARVDVLEQAVKRLSKLLDRMLKEDA